MGNDDRASSGGGIVTGRTHLGHEIIRSIASPIPNSGSGKTRRRDLANRRAHCAAGPLMGTAGQMASCTACERNITTVPRMGAKR